MKSWFKKWEKRDAQWATTIAKERYERAVEFCENVDTDPEKEKRLKVHECAPCFYGARGYGRVAGSAMTHWNCGICEREGLASSTHTPKLCCDCGKTHALCTNCGGDLELREGRRKFDFGGDHGKATGNSVQGTGET